MKKEHAFTGACVCRKPVLHSSALTLRPAAQHPPPPNLLQNRILRQIAGSATAGGLGRIVVLVGLRFAGGSIVRPFIA
jgi:hypothetical protein